MTKKAQATLEFFMTYGWAIIIIIALVAILIYFGTFKVPVSEKCVLPTSSGLFCDKSAILNSNITLKIKNSMQEDIDISSDSSVSYKGNVCILTETKTIKTETAEILVFNGLDCANLLKPGQRIKARISLRYVDSTGFSKEVIGTLVSQVS